jgi:hypothetical protein
MSLSLFVSGCHQSPSPPATTASISSAPTTGRLTAPGLARQALADLIAAAGTTHALRVEFTADTATLTVVVGNSTQAWRWQDGTVQAAATDIAYVGQTIFDPQDFALDDLGDLFARAAAQSGSAKGQRLDLAEYSNHQIFASVTTTPESHPVFFWWDGSLVAALDFTTTAGLTCGLAELTAGRSEVMAVGLDQASGGLYAIYRDTNGQIVRGLRMPRLPVHQSAWTATTTDTGFDPALIDPAALTAVAQQLPELTGRSVSRFGFTIEQRPPALRPVVYFSVGGQEIRTTLAGHVVS